MIADYPFELAQEFGVVPVADDGGAVAVATAPHMTVAALAAARQRIGKPLRTQAVDETRFRQLLTQWYAQAGVPRAVDSGTTLSASASSTPAAASVLSANDDGPTDLLATGSVTSDEAPAVRIVGELLRDALARGASDVHLDATHGGGRVRFRVDGVLGDVRDTDAATHAAMIARCKVMANLDIAERRLPQDGRLQVLIAGCRVDVRIATLPTQYGERAVLRLLDTSAARLDLESLGCPAATVAALRQAVRAPHGLVLVTGPTGSGKTTTLYAAVSELDRERLNVVSVEDPVEYALDRVAQTQVNPRIELSFARALRSILRHDPDVIIVGEIRDRETAEIAIQASLTGHLVLASLHTNTAGAAVTRLVDMGVEPYLIASSLRGVVAQRLVRRLCPQCRHVAPTTPSEAALLIQHGVVPSGAGTGAIAALYQSRGCAQCNDTGYRGRIGLYRWLPASSAVVRGIHDRVADTALEALASEQGWPALAPAARDTLERGETSLAEVLRVVAL
ncbi:MAG: type II/IV secretion system protein [Burkholderiales bacterium]|nr:type II/IV secretion system protein [Burkholderiales bacterium]